MDFFDVIMNNAEFEQIECLDTTDDNRVCFDTEISIKVTFKNTGYYAVSTFLCIDAVKEGASLDDDDVWMKLRWHSLECLDIPKFAVGKI